MIFIGDVHGCFEAYKYIINNYNDSTFQVGDMGVGFGNQRENFLKTISEKNAWIRGNHDNPNTCKDFSSYLNDWGWNEDLNMFWLGGGLSIDQHFRTAGKDWWWDEELSYSALNKARNKYLEMKPKIVVSHECPLSAKSFVINPMFSNMANRYGDSRTSIWLQKMFEGWKPETWIFGHYHIRKSFTIEGCDFECLDMARYYHYDHLKFTDPNEFEKEINRVTLKIPNLTW